MDSWLWQEDYGYPNQTVTFLDNHDVTRFGYTQRSQKVYNAALAVLLTSRGIPTIYYGTEQYVVPDDASDVAGRVYMPTECGFSTTTAAYQLIADLSALRQSNDAIASAAVRYGIIEEGSDCEYASIEGVCLIIDEAKTQIALYQDL